MNFLQISFAPKKFSVCWESNSSFDFLHKSHCISFPSLSWNVLQSWSQHFLSVTPSEHCRFVLIQHFSLFSNPSIPFTQSVSGLLNFMSFLFHMNFLQNFLSFNATTTLNFYTGFMWIDIFSSFQIFFYNFFICFS